MSRSVPNDRPINPATRFFEWNGEKGHFKYYNKETKENVVVDLPFTFLVLDDKLSTIKGWSDADQSGIWSNEVKDLKTGVLTVRTSKGVQVEGTYENIKGKVAGADYVKSLYIAYINEDKKLVIGNISIKGASLNSWIEFTKAQKDVYAGIIKVADCIEGKKGKVVYQMPNFVMTPAPEKALTMALELDKQLQEYLTKYFSYATTIPEAVPTAEEVEATFNAEPGEELSAKEIAMAKQQEKNGAIQADPSDLPWDM
jgi:hypothetical protein